MNRLRQWLDRALCMLGLHQFEVIEVRMGFGPSGAVETVRCRRCGHVRARRSVS